MDHENAKQREKRQGMVVQTHKKSLILSVTCARTRKSKHFDQQWQIDHTFLHFLGVNSRFRNLEEVPNKQIKKTEMLWLMRWVVWLFCVRIEKSVAASIDWITISIGYCLLGWVPKELNFCDAELHSRLNLTLCFFSTLGKIEISTRFTSTESSCQTKAICKWTVNNEERETTKFFIF